MVLCSLIEELCTKEENDKTGCNFNFGHEWISLNIKINTCHSYVQKHVSYIVSHKRFLGDTLWAMLGNG